LIVIVPLQVSPDEKLKLNDPTPGNEKVVSPKKKFVLFFQGKVKDRAAKLVVEIAEPESTNFCCVDCKAV
jgi:hypothetical protein